MFKACSKHLSIYLLLTQNSDGHKGRKKPH